MLFCVWRKISHRPCRSDDCKSAPIFSAYCVRPLYGSRVEFTEVLPALRRQSKVQRATHDHFPIVRKQENCSPLNNPILQSHPLENLHTFCEVNVQYLMCGAIHKFASCCYSSATAVVIFPIHLSIQPTSQQPLGMETSEQFAGQEVVQQKL